MILKPVFKNSFLKNVLTLLTGTTLAQAIPVLTTPILTRIYSPDEIGIYTIFFATVNIVAIVSSGRLEQAILIPKYKKNSFDVLKLSLVFSLCVCLFLLLLIIFFKKRLLNILGLESINNGIYLIPITACFLGIFQIYNYWLNRNDHYTSISKGKIIQGGITAIISISLSIFNTFGLILGRAGGVLFSSLFVVYAAKKLSPKIFPFNRSSLMSSLKKNKDFPLYTMPNAVLNAVSNNLPLYLLEFFYSAKITGFYSWSVRIIQGPMGMLTASIQQVFFRNASEFYNNEGDLYSLTIKLYKRLFLIGIFPYTFIFFFAPDIFAFFFGKEWRIAGEYTSYLIPWFFVMFLNSPVSSLILILKKQKAYFMFEIALFTFRGLSLFVGYYFFNQAKYSIILYGATGLIFNLMLLFILIRISKNASRK